MTSTHEGELHLPSLPLSARHVHIVPALQQFSLISMGQLCDAGCLIAFTASTVTVSFNDDIILTGHRTPATLLWHFDLPVLPSPPPLPLAAANATIGCKLPSPTLPSTPPPSQPWSLLSTAATSLISLASPLPSFANTRLSLLL